MHHQVISIILLLAILLSAMPAQALAVDTAEMPADVVTVPELDAETADEIWHMDNEIRAYQPRYYNFKTGTWTGTPAEKLVQVVRAQIGLTGADLGYSEQWGADFVCDAAYLAGISQEVIPWGYAGTSAIVSKLYEELGNLGAKSIVPAAAQPGDLVFFDYDRTSTASTSTAEDLDQVAVVTAYDTQNALLRCVGGNQGSYSSLETRRVTEDVYNTTTSRSIAFVLRPNYVYLLSIVTDGPGSVTGAGKFADGDYARVSATPYPGCTFLGWYAENGTLLSTVQTVSVLMKRNTRITAKFSHGVTVTTQASRSGTVTGDGLYEVGSTVTLTANGDLSGWYDIWGNLKSTDRTYTFPAAENVTIWALFRGDVFVDIPADAWYIDEVLEAHQQGLIKGVTNVSFEAARKLTRGMATVMLHRLAGEPGHTSRGSFADVDPGDWYYDAAEWAHETGLYAGVGTFGPNDPISRQEYFEMAVKLLNGRGYSVVPVDLPFIDVENQTDLLRQAYAMGILKGDGDGKMRPTGTLNRSEGAAILVRVAKLMP